MTAKKTQLERRIEDAAPLLKARADTIVSDDYKAELRTWLASPEAEKLFRQDNQFQAMMARQLDGIGMDAWTPTDMNDWASLANCLGIDPGPLNMVEIQREVVKAIRETPKTQTGDEWGKLTRNGSTLVRHLLACQNWESTITNTLKALGKKASSSKDKKAFDRAVQRTNNDLSEHYPAYEIERLQRSKSIRLVKA